MILKKFQNKMLFLAQKKKKKAGELIFIFSIFCPKFYFKKNLAYLVRIFGQSQSVWVHV